MWKQSDSCKMEKSLVFEYGFSLQNTTANSGVSINLVPRVPGFFSLFLALPSSWSSLDGQW